MKLALSIIIPVAVFSVACGATPIPADKFARSTATIRSAEVMNADAVPSASGYLRLARDQVAGAKRLLIQGDNEQAGYLLIRAEADADAAMNLAREAAVRQEALQTIQSVRALKAQMEVPRS